MTTPTTPPAPEEQPDDVTIQGHNYDGIREYDNPMPGWWVWLFWLTIVFAPIYFLGVHVFGFINTYEEDLAANQQELQEMRDAYAAAHPSFSADAETLARYVADPAQAEAGKATFMLYCMPCHGDQGQGLIGPNLTDNYWLHGNTDVEIFTTITNGVVEKGMTAWENTLTAEQRAQLVAYIRSIAGTNPPGAKEPQGTLYE